VLVNFRTHFIWLTQGLLPDPSMVHADSNRCKLFLFSEAWRFPICSSHCLFFVGVLASWTNGGVKRATYSLGNSLFCLLQRFQRRDRDEGRRDGGRDSGAGADRERQRRERLQQQKRGQWNAYWQDKNAPRNVYNSSVCGSSWSLWTIQFKEFLLHSWNS